MSRWIWAGLAALALGAGEARAQRAAENAVTSAEDAFGASVGRESLAGRLNEASLRLRVTNLFDVHYFDLRGSGAYDLTPGRVASLALAMDF